jgi:hypothetical protein
MVELPAELLARFGVAPLHRVEFGAVFDLKPPHPRYFDIDYARPAVVVRAQRAGDGAPVKAWLFYASTKKVAPARALELRAGQGGLRKDCRLDNLPYKEMTVEDLMSDCEYLGRLDELTRGRLEAHVQSARQLPRFVKRMAR